MLRDCYRPALRALCLVSCFAGSAAAHVTLLSPDGGEVFSVGQTVTIEWQITVQHQLDNWDLRYSVTGIGGPYIPFATDLPPGSPSAGSVHTYEWIVPDNVSNQVRVKVVMDNLDSNYIAISAADLSIVPCASPATYCSTSMNSVGSGATIGWTGTPNVSTNAFVLTASGAPANKPALFFYGPNQVSLPLGDGLRCVGGNITRLSVLFTDGGGQASHGLDVTSAPALGAGSTHNFQLWYRDPLGGPSGFNLTDGLSVTFCP